MVFCLKCDYVKVKTNRVRWEKKTDVGIQKKRKGQMKSYKKDNEHLKRLTNPTPKPQALISNL